MGWTVSQAAEGSSLAQPAVLLELTLSVVMAAVQNTFCQPPPSLPGYAWEGAEAKMKDRILEP